MAIAYVNSAFSTSSGTAGTTKTISYTPTAGNTLIVFAFGAAVAATQCTDTLNNLYALFMTPTSNTAEVSTFVCRQCAGGATTITVTFASSTKNTCVVVEYSGALEVGLKNTATGSSTTPSVAITTEDANNFVVAGMSTESTSTWATDTGFGTLRNSQVGASSTTPGGGVVDNTAASAGSVTCSATLGTTGAWATQAVELRTALQPFLTDQGIEAYQKPILPQFSLGTLQLYFELENLNWGYLFDTKMSIDNERFDIPPQTRSFVVPELDTDTEWGYNKPLAGTGSQAMAYSGHWSLKPAMGSVDDFNYTVPNVIAKEDMYIDTWAFTAFTEEDNEGEQFGFNPVVATVQLPWDTEFNLPQLLSYVPLDDQFDWGYALPLAGTGSQYMGFAGYAVTKPAMVEEAWGYNPTVVTVTLAWDTEFNTAQQSLYFSCVGVEDVDWEYEPACCQLPLDECLYDIPLTLSPLIYQDVESDQVTPEGFLTDRIPFDYEQLILPTQFPIQLVELEQVYPNPPFLTPYWYDDSPDYWDPAWRMMDDVEQPNFAEVFIPEDQVQTLVVSQSYQDDDQFSYNPIIAALPNMLYDTDYNPVQQTSLYFNCLDTEEFDWGYNLPLSGTGSQMMGFAGYAVTKSAMPEEAWGYNQVVVTVVNAFLEEQNPIQLNFAYYEDLFVYGVFVPALPNMLYDAEFNPTIQLSYYFNSLETEQFDWGYNLPLAGTGSQSQGYAGFWASKPAMGTIDDWSFNPPLVATPLLPWDIDYPPVQLNLIYDVEEQLGVVLPFMAGGLQLMGFRGYLIPKQGMVEDAWGFNPPAPQVFNAFLEDENPLAPIVITHQVELDQVFPSAPFITPTSEVWELYGQVTNPPYPVVDDVDQLNFSPVLIDDGSHGIMLSTAATAAMFDDLFIYGVFVPALPNMLYDAEYNPTMQQSYYFGSMDNEEFEWGYKPPTIATYQEDALYQDKPQLQSFTPEIEDEQFNWGYNLPLAGVGAQMMGYSGGWASKSAMTEDSWGFNPPAVVAPITPFDEDQYPIQISLGVHREDVEQFGVLLPFAAGGLQLMGFRGYNIPQAGRDVASEFVYPPIIPPLPVMLYESELNQPQQISFFFDSLEAEDPHPAPPFITPIPFDDSPEQFTQQYPVKDDPDMFIYPAIIPPLPNMLYDADYNPGAIQLSYYFTDMDTEEFDWGYKPPTLITYQEDALYQDLPKQISFIPEIEDEMFNFGWLPPVTPLSDNIDDNQYPHQMFWNLGWPEDIGFLGIPNIVPLGIPVLYNAVITPTVVLGSATIQQAAQLMGVSAVLSATLKSVTIQQAVQLQNVLAVPRVMLQAVINA